MNFGPLRYTRQQDMTLLVETSRKIETLSVFLFQKREC